MNTQYKPLFEEITLPNGIVLSDRLGVAPMTTYSGNPDGTVSDAELAYYQRRANLGSLFVSACIAVSENGIAFPNQFVAFKDDVMPRLKQLATEMKSQGSKAILQMQHGGRQGQPDLIQAGETVAPSAIAESADKPTPRALTGEEITDIIRDFGETTRRAIEAGFDGVEIHGANTYLIQQFVSATFNQREDEWGGSLENRLKFGVAVLDEVKRVASEYADDSFIIGYRLSPEENNADSVGYTIEETKQLVELLIDGGIHYIHVSLMEFTKAPRGMEDGDSIVKILSKQINGRVAFVVVGGVTQPEHAVAALEEGADIIVMGRQALVDPEWTQKVKQGNEADINETIPQELVGKLDIPETMWNAITSYGMVKVDAKV